MTDLDGTEKNIDEVRKGWDRVFAEWKEADAKIKDAVNNKDWLDVLHHGSDYLGAILQHAWRTHLYLFIPKWGLIIYLVTSNG